MFPSAAQMTCGVDEFRCKDSGRCIPARWKCDGEDDCGDASDEPKEECGTNIFSFYKLDRCATHISNVGFCFYFMTVTFSVICTAERTCEPYQFRCKNNRCVPGRWQCDYDNDCGDNSDEDKCSMCHFQLRDNGFTLYTVNICYLTSSSVTYCTLMPCPLVTHSLCNFNLLTVHTNIHSLSFLMHFTSSDICFISYCPVGVSQR